MTRISPLEVRLAALLEQRKAQSRLRTLKASPPNSIDLSSNDFLSLATNPHFQEDYLDELHTNHISAIGSTGSRLLDGNSIYAETLEQDIASFHGGETGLLTNSGFDANVSIFMCLPQPGDVIVYDELIHASVYDGMRQSRSKRQIAFRHNSVDDLRTVLKDVCQSVSRDQNVFIAVESVYSMDGDLAPLTEMVDLIEKLFPRGNAHLIVDEAHATGVYGPLGRGRVSELGLEKRVSVRLHTFGKALACNGAIIICSPIIRSYLINYARPLIYTTFMSYPSLTAIKVAYDWLKSGKTETASKHLFNLIDTLYTSLQSLQPRIDLVDTANNTNTDPSINKNQTSSVLSNNNNDNTNLNPNILTNTATTLLPRSTTPQSRQTQISLRASNPASSILQESILTLPPSKPSSPIFALQTPHPRELATYCQSSKFIVRAVVPPTVAPGTERVRVCLHSGNTVEEIQGFVDCVGRWVDLKMHSVREGRIDDETSRVETGDDERKEEKMIGQEGKISSLSSASSSPRDQSSVAVLRDGERRGSDRSRVVLSFEGRLDDLGRDVKAKL